jgi:molybdopterin-guanine dinucleotide biosynthesis protein A
MKSNKALLPYRGELFIQHIHRQLAATFPDVILVTNTPELYRFIPCRSVPDIYPGRGSLAGIHAGLSQSETPYIFAVACDMPYLSGALIRRLLTAIDGQDVVMPESDAGLEPLHAIYGKGCLPAMEAALSRGPGRIIACLDWNKATVVKKAEVAQIDPEFRSFRNINTPEEYFRLREELREKQDAKER